MRIEWALGDEWKMDTGNEKCVRRRKITDKTANNENSFDTTSIDGEISER